MEEFEVDNEAVACLDGTIGLYGIDIAACDGRPGPCPPGGVPHQGHIEFTACQTVFLLHHDDVTRTGETVDVLVNAYPELGSFRLKYAVNSAYASLETELHDGDEVACIPPVGGG